MARIEQKIVLGFDIRGFSILSGLEQYDAQERMNSLVNDFLKNNANISSQYKGDGYYLAGYTSLGVLKLFIALLVSLVDALDGIDFRFVFSMGDISNVPNVRGENSFTGRCVTEADRILSFVKPGSMIFLTSYIYEYIFRKTKVSTLLDTVEIAVIKKVKITTKNDQVFDAYNVRIVSDYKIYGFEFQESPRPGEDKSDLLSHEQIASILDASFPNRNVARLSGDIRPDVSHALFSVEVAPNLEVGFLFLGKHINKNKTLGIVFNNEIPSTLTICANKRYFDEDRSRYWGSDLLKKVDMKKNDYNKQFKIDFYYLNDYIWKYCFDKSMKEASGYDDSGIYIDPNFSIGENDLELHQNVSLFLDNVVKTNISPITMIIGDGGIGKTTILKKIEQKINKDAQNQKFALFIDGSELSTQINKRVDYEIENIYSLYELISFYCSSTRALNYQFVRNKDFINIAVSSGTLIVLIDGIDEIFSSLKSKFSFKDFIENIFRVNDLLNNCQVFISARTYFWESEKINITKSYPDYINVIRLRGFDENLIEEYYSKKFISTKDQSKNALSLYKRLIPENSPLFGVPFVIYVVSDFIQKKQDKEDLDISESEYLTHSDDLDNVIKEICSRDLFRQKLSISIDNYLDLFYYILVSHKGKMSIDDLVALYGQDKIITDGYNPILSTILLNVSSDHYISMCHKYIEDHIISVFGVYYIRHIEKLDQDLISVLAKYSDGGGDIINKMSKRFRHFNVQCDMFKNFFKKILSDLRGCGNIRTKENYGKAISFLLYLAMQSGVCGPSKTMKDKTDIILNLYDGHISDLYIYGDFWALDFRDMKIEESSFINYRKFSRSTFERTRFSRCRFQNIINPSRSKLMSIKKEMFDEKCIFDDNSKLIISSINNEATMIKKCIARDVRNMVGRFYRNDKLAWADIENLDFDTTSGINYRDYFQHFLGSGVIYKVDKPDHNRYTLSREYEESMRSLKQNGYPDSKITKIINTLFKKFYTQR